MSEETDDRNTSIIVTDCNCIVYSISLIIILELFELPNDFKRLPSSFIVIFRLFLYLPHGPLNEEVPVWRQVFKKLSCCTLHQVLNKVQIISNVTVFTHRKSVRYKTRFDLQSFDKLDF
jgi:hypothetical protein